MFRLYKGFRVTLALGAIALLACAQWDHCSNSPYAQRQKKDQPTVIHRAVKPRDVPPTSLTNNSAQCLRPYFNTQLNSRAEYAIPADSLEVLWKSAIDPFFPCRFILHAGNRIILQSNNRWQLFNLSGESISMETIGDGDVVIDEKGMHAYMFDTYGRVAVAKLTDGMKEFVIPVGGTSDYKRTFLSVKDDVLVVCSSKRSSNPHDPTPVMISSADVFDMRSREISEGVLVSATERGARSITTERLLAAISGATLVLAWKDHFSIADMELHTKLDLTDEFTPLSISLDDADRIFAQVLLKGDRYALWVLDTNGELYTEVELPSEPIMPPVIGYDHTAYIVLAESIIAVDQRGTTIWTQPAGGAVGGCAVTADDGLVVAAGNLISVLNNKGERKILHVFPGERLTSVPVVTSAGGLAVTTQDFLYYLTVKGKAR